MHKISPSSKFLWGAVVMLWLFLMFEPLHVLIFGLLILASAKLGAGLSVLNLLRTSAVVGVAGFFIIIFQGLLYPGETVIFNLGPLNATAEGIKVGLAIALRILAIVSASTIIAKTTSPREIFLTLVNMGVPYKLAYGLFTAIRFIPLMEYEAHTIRDAQFVRGIASKKGGIISKVKQAGNLLVPLIATGMRRADQSAASMEIRAFGLYPNRTYIHKLSYTRAGTVFLIIWIVALLVYIAVFQQNLLQAIFYNPPTG